MYLHSRPTTEHLPADLIALIGKIAIHSAYMDYLLGVLVAGLTDVNANTIHDKPTGDKIAAAKAAIKSSSLSREKSTSLFGTLKRAKDMLSERNLVIHGFIRYNENNLDNPEYLTFKGDYKGMRVPFSRCILEPILNDLYALSDNLTDACMELGYMKPRKLEP
jgi:hypothetical protein